MKFTLIFGLLGICEFVYGAEKVTDNPKATSGNQQLFFPIARLLNGSQFKLNQGVLEAPTTVPKNLTNPAEGYVECSINLHQFIGINGTNGEFDLSPGAQYFASQVLQPQIDIASGEAILTAVHPQDKFNGKQISVDLSYHLYFTGTGPQNMQFVFRKTSDNIANSGTGFHLEIERNSDNSIKSMMYSGYLEDKKGYLQPASFDLMQLEGIKNEAFTGAVDSDKLYLQPVQTVDPFQIEFRPISMDFSHVDQLTVWIPELLANDDGKLVSRQPDDPFFSKDGAVTTFVEGLPFFGYIAAGLHKIAGNTAHAERAIAKATYATIVSTAGVLGTLAGGPMGCAVAASLIASAVATGPALKVQELLKRKVSNSNLQGQIDDFTWMNWGKEAAIGAILGGSFGKLSDGIGQRVTAGVSASVSSKTAQLGVKVGAFLVDQGIDKTAGSVYVGMNTELTKLTLDGAVQIWNSKHPNLQNSFNITKLQPEENYESLKKTISISGSPDIHVVVPGSTAPEDTLEASDDPKALKKSKGKGAKTPKKSKGKGIDKGIKEGETTLDLAAAASTGAAQSTMATRTKTGKKKAAKTKKPKKTSATAA
ncbi:hypothetical protein TWF694_010009 [Orbilia ellipsospora]|uniref:Uncharacterized protein n=1 Tax=Orbilia ellipsospora TaxID=2528407 RepID=A0AAV9XB89_9PEZI